MLVVVSDSCESCDIAILGGGAAGLAAAIFAAEHAPSARVVLLDGARRLGAKVLVSGGARCNVTHERVTPRDFNAPQAFVRHVLAAFDEKAAVRWFESLGVRLKREPTGKLFPVTDDAHTVLNALVKRCESLGVSIHTHHRVHGVRVEVHGDQPRFRITHEQGHLEAQRTIFATGGRSLPRTGSDGAAWRLIETLGHRVTPTYPALVPLVLAPTMFHKDLSGLSATVTLSTYADGKRIDQRTGGLLWTHFGISGPVVMDASRFWVTAHAQGRQPKLRCSFLPDQSFIHVEQQLLAQAAAHPKRQLLSATHEIVSPRLAACLLQHDGIEPTTPLAHLSRENRRRLIHLLIDLDLQVAHDRGWNYAEVTAGGVPLDEIHHTTMASRIVPGLYAVGEMLDGDGRIGGFNFQWAWSTGFIAGRSAAASLFAAEKKDHPAKE
jgi:predicted Rossmann fold flavoprotein